MPFALTVTSKKLTMDEKDKIRVGIDDLIKGIPGKAQFSSFIIVMDDVYMHFQDSDPSFYLELNMMGEALPEEKEAFAKSVSAYVEDTLGIPPLHTMININEKFEWGARGKYTLLPKGTSTLDAH